MNYGTQGQNGDALSSAAAAHAGSSRTEHEPAPPSYAEVVTGDHKVQSNE